MHRIHRILPFPILFILCIHVKKAALYSAHGAFVALAPHCLCLSFRPPVHRVPKDKAAGTAALRNSPECPPP